MPKLIASMVPALASPSYSKLSTQTLALLIPLLLLLLLLRSPPPAILSATRSFVLAYTSDRFSELTFHTVNPLVVAWVGFVISASTMDSVARYVSVYLYLSGGVCSSIIA